MRPDYLPTDQITVVVIHDGDEEEVFICSSSEVAWSRAANQMIGWLGNLQDNYSVSDEDLMHLKVKIENQDYAGAAELWNELTNGDQYFQVDIASVLTQEPAPVWPADLTV